MLNAASQTTKSMPRPSQNGVYVYDATATPWTDAGKPGLYQKLVRGDEQKGEFLGLLGFALLAPGRTNVLGVLGFVARAEAADWRLGTKHRSG